MVPITVAIGNHITARDHWCAVIAVATGREGGARIVCLDVEAFAGIPGLLESFANKFIRRKRVHVIRVNSLA
jgi:hypothetical protein